MTAQNQLRQILSDNKTCKNSGCACCAHWNTTVYRLLTLLGTVLDTFQIAVAARNRLLQEIANLKRQLLLYDNPNTPSSQKRISHKKQRMAQNGSDNVTKRLAGAQPRHNKTAENLPIDGGEHHRCSNCPAHFDVSIVCDKLEAVGGGGLCPGPLGGGQLRGWTCASFLGARRIPASCLR